MSRVLLDTSAYSALMNGQAMTAGVVREAEEIFLNAVVIGELLAGFARGQRRQRNERQLSEFLDETRVNVVDVDDDTAVRYAAIHSVLRAAGTPIPTNDMWIAASAMQHGLRLLTLDHHFEKIPQILSTIV